MIIIINKLSEFLWRFYLKYLNKIVVVGNVLCSIHLYKCTLYKCIVHWCTVYLYTKMNSWYYNYIKYNVRNWEAFVRPKSNWDCRAVPLAMMFCWTCLLISKWWYLCHSHETTVLGIKQLIVMKYCSCFYWSLLL